MNKKKESIKIVISAIICMGLISIFPIMQLINKDNQTKVVNDYNILTEAMKEKEIEKEMAKARAFNESLLSGINKQTIPESFSAKQDLDPYYKSILKINNCDAMATLEIPSIDVLLPIYHGTTDESLDKGVGHVEGSSFPIGGKNTHACLAAHRAMPGKRLFTDLDQMKKGDQFYITVLTKKIAYKVYKVEIVEPENVSPLEIKQDKDLVTLITCHPYSINTHRIYVHAYRIPYVPDEDGFDIDWMMLLRKYWWVLVNLIILVWMARTLYKINRKGKKNGKWKN